jgi:hypothetical protein
MSRFSPLQLLLLAFGASLIFLSLTLDHLPRLWQRAPVVAAFEWKHLKLVPAQDQRLEMLDAETVVVRSSRFPSARLTLFTRPDDGVTPQRMVRNLCRRDSCSYSAIGTDANNNGAAATYRQGEPLRIVLMQPGGKEIWLEFKGPPDAFDDFSGLVDSITLQMQPPPPLAGES